MAKDIVGSLFGVSPEMYQEERNRQGMRDAIAMAQLDPMQYANAAIQAGAGRAAGGFAGLMGVEDPQMRLISQRNALAKQIDMNDPESIMRGAQMAAQSGDTVAASTLANYARKASSDLALIQQRTAEKMTPEQRNAIAESQLTDRLDQLNRFPQSPERDRAINSTKNQLTALTRGKPEKVSDAIQIAREVGVLTDALAKTQEGTTEYNSIKAQIDRLEKSEKAPSQLDIQKAQIYRQTLIDGKAPASQIAEVDAYIKGLTTGKGTVVQNVMPEYPGDKKIADIPAFRLSVQKTVEPMSKVVFATDNALTNINDSIATNNFASFRAAQVQFARAIAGSGDLSQKELLAAGADPALLGGTADYISRLFSSTPTIDTQNKIKSTLEAIKTVSVNKANEEIDRQRKIALRNKNYNPQDVETALDFPEFRKPMVGTGPYSDAGKEQRYQEYKRTQSGVNK
jgi:ribosomal protein S5